MDKELWYHSNHTEHQCPQTSVLNAGYQDTGEQVALQNKIKGMKDFDLDSDLGFKVKGNLRRHKNYWRDVLVANSFVIDIIENGYKIPFLSSPQPCKLKNNKSALAEPKFVEESIAELLKYNRIYEVKDPFLINQLKAEDSKGKKRLILDLRHVNNFVYKQKIKFDDWKIFQNFVEDRGPGYLFKFDLKSGYHHIEIHIRIVKSICVFLGNSRTERQSIFNLQFYLLVYLQPLIFLQKLLEF